MPRIALMLVVFVLLGVMINLAAAWTVAAFKIPDGRTLQQLATSRQLRTVQWSYPGAKPKPEGLYEFYRLEMRAADVDFFKVDRMDITEPIPTAFRIGVPWKSVAMWSELDILNGSSAKPPATHGAISFPRSTIELPVYPLWPGFALNTIFYALIALGGWELWQIPGAIRRRSRRRAGRCVKCGYDRAGLAAGAVCPECGSRQSAKCKMQSADPDKEKAPA